MKRGIVKAVNISEAKGVVKTPVDSVVMVEDFGIQGDAHSGGGKRQVSLLAQESVNKMIAMTGRNDLTEGVFAENITVEGLELHTLPVGTKLKIGETLHVVSQIGKDCHSGCAIMKQWAVYNAARRYLYPSADRRRGQAGRYHRGYRISIAIKTNKPPKLEISL